MTDMTEQTFYPGNHSGIFNRGVAVSAFSIVFIILYIGKSVSNWYVLLGFSLFAGVLPYILHFVRSLIGSIEALTLSCDVIIIKRKKDSETIAWKDLKSVVFESVNETLWLTLETNEKLTQRLCLEDFTTEDQESIYSEIVGQVRDKTVEKETWIIANRIPVSLNIEIKSDEELKIKD